MPILTKATAKTFFETGDRPTQDEFATTLDSVVFQPSSAGSLKTGFVEIVTTAAATAWASAGVIPVTTEASGAVARTLGDRFADEINVKDFGATGDGATADTQAFTNAEAERVAKSFNTVYVPSGTYLVSSAPSWNKITGPGIISYNGDLIPAGDIRGDQFYTINVPGTFATIKDVMDYLNTRTISYSQAQAARITVQVADGIYESANQIVLNHPQGFAVAFKGNETTPDNCVLRFTHGGTQNGLVVSQSHSVGFVNGFLIDMSAKALWPNAGTGILSETNSTMILGNNMKVNNFYYGAMGTYGGHVRANRIEINNAGDVGLFGINNGTVEGTSAKATNTDDPVNLLGSDMVGEWGGLINVVNAFTSGARIEGINAVNNGIVRTLNTATGEGDHVILQRERLIAVGSAATVDLEVVPKGSAAAPGYIQLHTTFVTAATSAIGYVDMKDDSGTIRRFVIAGT